MAIGLKENSKDISSNSCPLGCPEEGYWPSLADITDQDFTQGVYLCIKDKPPPGGKRICLQWGLYFIKPASHMYSLTPVITLANS